MNNDDMTFTLDEFDNAVAEECADIALNKDYKDKTVGAALLTMTGMAFSAKVRQRMIENKKEA